MFDYNRQQMWRKQRLAERKNIREQFLKTYFQYVEACENITRSHAEIGDLCQFVIPDLNSVQAELDNLAKKWDMLEPNEIAGILNTIQELVKTTFDK